MPEVRGVRAIMQHDEEAVDLIGFSARDTDESIVRLDAFAL